MPRLEEYALKLKKAPPYRRKSLRPWDDIEKLKPTDDNNLKTNQSKAKPSTQIGEQLDNKEEENDLLKRKVKSLSGLQRKLLFYIVENCKARSSLHTTPITNENLRNLLDTDKNSVKTTVHRLAQKTVIDRQQEKRGKGGFYIFIVSKEIIEAVIELKWELNFSKQLDNKPDFEFR